jgi:hypothetical protein
MFLVVKGAKGLPNGKEQVREESPGLTYASYKTRMQIHCNVEANVIEELNWVPTSFALFGCKRGTRACFYGKVGIRSA